LLALTSTSVNTRYRANIVNGTPGITRTAAEVRKIDPMLAPSGDVFRLRAGSPAIDAADPSFAFVTDDFEGQARVHPDIGADELSTAPVSRRPLTERDVGPSAP
jgi:hypothetical protein